jgi:hypothetical protein
MSRMRTQMSSSRQYLWVIVLGIAAVFAVLAVVLARLPIPVSAAEVVGTYVASYPFGTETITLNPDGTYVQRVEVAGDPPPQPRWVAGPLIPTATMRAM